MIVSPIRIVVARVAVICSKKLWLVESWTLSQRTASRGTAGFSADGRNIRWRIRHVSHCSLSHSNVVVGSGINGVTVSSSYKVTTKMLLMAMFDHVAVAAKLLNKLL